MKVLITEEQYENLINEMGRQGGAHSYKEYLKFIIIKGNGQYL